MNHEWTARTEGWYSYILSFRLAKLVSFQFTSTNLDAISQIWGCPKGTLDLIVSIYSIRIIQFLRRGDFRHGHLEVFPQKNNRPWHHNACAVRDRKCLTVSLANVEGSKHIHGGNEIQMFCLLLWFKSTLKSKPIDVCLLSLLILSFLKGLLQATQVGAVAVIHPEFLQLHGALFQNFGTNGKKWHGICCNDTTYRTQAARKTISTVYQQKCYYVLCIYIYDKCAWFSVRWDS